MKQLPSDEGRARGAGRLLPWLLPLALLAMVLELGVIGQALRINQGRVPTRERTSGPEQLQTSPGLNQLVKTEASPAPTSAASSVDLVIPPTLAPPEVREPNPTPPGQKPVADLSGQSATAISTSEPAEAVESFYRLVDDGQFERAAQLWSARMRASFPPAENISRRFSLTERITVQRAEVVALDETAGRASVAVDLVEVAGTPPTTRRFVGTWQVVRTGSGWVLDQPSLRPG